MIQCFARFQLVWKPLESPADSFITQQTLRHALLIAHLRRQGQRPYPRGLVVGARRLMQDMLEAVTVGGIQHGATVFGRVDCFSKLAMPRVLKA